jgi:hypothetical protein
MGCDDGFGNCYTRDVDGRIILFSVGDELTPEGIEHVYKFKRMLDTAGKPDEKAEVIPINDSKSPKKY